MDKPNQTNQSGNDRISASLFGGKAVSGRDEAVEQLRRRQQDGHSRRNRAMMAFIVPVVVMALVLLFIGLKRQQIPDAQPAAMPPPAPEEVAESLKKATTEEAKEDWKAIREGNCATGKIQVEFIIGSAEMLEVSPEAAPIQMAVDKKPSHIGVAMRFWNQNPEIIELQRKGGALPARKLAINGSSVVEYTVNGVRYTADLNSPAFQPERLYEILNALHAQFYPDEQYPLCLKKKTQPVTPPEVLQEKEETTTNALQMKFPEGFSRD